MYNESIKNKYTITYDSWYTECKLSTDGIEFQLDIGSAKQGNSPIYLTGGFQTADRIATPKKIRAILDNVNLKKIFVKQMVIDIQKMLFSQLCLKMIM